MKDMLTIMFIASVAIVVLGLIATALEKALTHNLGKLLESGINDLKVNATFRDRWDKNPNSILYTWRGLLWDLQNMNAPIGEIEAAKRQLKHYERSLKKAKTYVSTNGLVRTTIIGGDA